MATTACAPLVSAARFHCCSDFARVAERRVFPFRCYRFDEFCKAAAVDKRWGARFGASLTEARAYEAEQSAVSGTNQLTRSSRTEHAGEPIAPATGFPVRMQRSVGSSASRVCGRRAMLRLTCMQIGKAGAGRRAFDWAVLEQRRHPLPAFVPAAE